MASPESIGASASIPVSRDVRHPDIAGVLTEVEDDLVARDRDPWRAEVQIPPRQTSPVEMLDADGWLHRPLRRGIEPLRPQTWRAIAIRPEVKKIRLRRPAGRITVPADLDPFLLGSDRRTLNSGDEHACGSQSVRPAVECDPPVVRRKARVVDPVTLMAQSRVVGRSAKLEETDA
jgi:hypothetical protein